MWKYILLLLIAHGCQLRVFSSSAGAGVETAAYARRLKRQKRICLTRRPDRGNQVRT
jgi:hypothetical protein